ncbi:cobyric acid synthase [Ilumatobacter sp.]|uniref:cobyric acid synthase n=1 Tax=Ilumatobacter sp. TaxID=1967498 RepID=UPI0037500E01
MPERSSDDISTDDPRPKDLSGALMVCGTTSNSGKTTIVAGLCRLLARNGVSVAPFKAQNMALNSAVTETGHEIGRAQYLQAQAAGITPEVAMNPILLKPTGERSSQVVVMGKAIGTMSAVEYHEAKPGLFALVLDALADLRSRFDVVLLEGAGSPAEINLLAHDIVNLRVADAAGVHAIVVGDIDPGGVFAALHGTVALLPDELRRLVGGFVINKFRGDPALLLDGTEQLERSSGVPTLGVIPMLEGLRLDAEDSLALDVPLDQAPTNPATGRAASLDVAVIRLPRISNFTDIDPLILEADVAVRFVRSARELGRPDLVILPGSKATVDDMAWLRDRGIDTAIAELVAAGRTTILGICGGYQMLGHVIHDDVESSVGSVAGLGLLPVSTTFEGDKVLASRSGSAFGAPVAGYQIHHGRVRPESADATAWLTLDGGGNAECEGYTDGAAVFGTTLHGLFELNAFRHAFLGTVAARAGAPFALGDVAPAQHREAELDRLADHLAASIALPTLYQLIRTTP